MQSSTAVFSCPQLECCFPRIAREATQLGLWSGGLRVSNHASEQYLSGSDDDVASLVSLPIASMGKEWFGHWQTEMQALDALSKVLYARVFAYFKHQGGDGTNHAGQAVNLFWQGCESHYQDLIKYCGEGMDQERNALRKVFVGFVYRFYDHYCPRETVRQLDAWAQSRPNLSKYLV